MLCLVVPRSLRFFLAVYLLVVSRTPPKGTLKSSQLLQLNLTIWTKIFTFTKLVTDSVGKLRKQMLCSALGRINHMDHSENTLPLSNSPHSGSLNMEAATPHRAKTVRAGGIILQIRGRAETN